MEEQPPDLHSSLVVCAEIEENSNDNSPKSSEKNSDVEMKDDGKNMGQDEDKQSSPNSDEGKEPFNTYPLKSAPK